MHFTVDRDGRVDNVTSPTTDVPEASCAIRSTSMKRSRYAPRIENGAAVPTENVVFVERVLVRVTPQPAQRRRRHLAKGAEKAPERWPKEPARRRSRRRSRRQP